MVKKVALITGVTGQDGSYLSELLLSKGYKVHGVKRRSSLINTQRVDHLYQHPDFKLHYGDVTDPLNIIHLLQSIQPDEIYNLAAMSHVQVSFETPHYSAMTNSIGALNILEAIRILGLSEKTKFYQASTSELYGKVMEIPQKETTPFYPRSPYGVAKQFAFWNIKNYREAYNIFACNGILFNHESPRRGETFVTRKITRAAAAYKLGLINRLEVGNIEAKRDWGHAKDYVKAMHLMLQQGTPDDYVIATGHTHSVKDMITLVFRNLDLYIQWNSMHHQDEPLAYINNTPVIYQNPKYFRPTEVDLLIGDPSKAKKELGWEPEYTFEQMIREMVLHDLEEIKKNGYNG